MERDVLMADVTGVDAAGRRVETTAGPMPYDYLVIATTPCAFLFRSRQRETVAPGLNLEDATRIRRSALLAFEQAELTHDDAERQRRTFVIVGGGAMASNGGGDRRHPPDAGHCICGSIRAPPASFC
jgi:NADH dehydrogenase